MIGSIPRPFCQKVLPLTYDNSLSYYEQLCKLVFKVNEVIDTFNEYESVIEELSKELVDIEQVKTRVSELESEITNLSNKLSNVDMNIEALSRRDNQLQNQIDNLYNSVNNLVNRYDAIISYVDNAIASVQLGNQEEWIAFQNSVNMSLSTMSREVRELAELVHRLGSDVYNPIKAIRETLDENNQDIYNDLRYGGITNAELSEFGVSNENIASLVLDNRDFALNARKRLKRHYLFSPVSGKWVSHENAISQAIVALIGSITNNAMVVTTNQMLYNYMATNSLTNENLSDLIVNNFSRYTISV